MIQKFKIINYDLFIISKVLEYISLRYDLSENQLISVLQYR